MRNGLHRLLYRPDGSYLAWQHDGHNDDPCARGVIPSCKRQGGPNHFWSRLSQHGDTSVEDNRKLATVLPVLGLVPSSSRVGPCCFSVER